MRYVGATPEPRMNVLPVGERIGRHLPVIGWVGTLGPDARVYAGAGEMSGDAVHLRAGSWHAAPRGLLSAMELAREKAALEGWVLVGTPGANAVERTLGRDADASTRDRASTVNATAAQAMPRKIFGVPVDAVKRSMGRAIGKMLG